jgi:SAM-dependent methyltransferase
MPLTSPRPVFTEHPSDAEFDALLPDYARARSEDYWTPAAVAQRAAQLFVDHGARRVLDVGSGIGKFCLLAAASQPEVEWIGIDRRELLVQDARALAVRSGLDNVRFECGDAFDCAWDAFDGFYFFNPFGENLVPVKERFDTSVRLSRSRFLEDVQHVESHLRALRTGSVLVTYHGLGGPIPSSFAIVSDEPAGTDRLRAWQKTSTEDAAWVHIETREGVCCAIHEQVRQAVRAASK